MSIPVLPKNYRRIALYAVAQADEPVVLVNKERIDDFSESGPLTQKRMREYIDFEIRDGCRPILGFHDHPREMWIENDFAEIAEYCQEQGWLKIERNAS